VHSDQCSTTWSIGLTCSRDIQDPPEGVKETRNSPWKIPAHGLDYVDVDIKVIVRGAAKTLTAFQPKWRHGTTRGHRIIQLGCALTSSCHVSDAYQEALKKGGCIRMLKRSTHNAELVWVEEKLSEISM
jgi:hypothetical protein